MSSVALSIPSLLSAPQKWAKCEKFREILNLLLAIELHYHYYHYFLGLKSLACQTSGERISSSVARFGTLDPRQRRKSSRRHSEFVLFVVPGCSGIIPMLFSFYWKVRPGIDGHGALGECSAQMPNAKITL